MRGEEPKHGFGAVVAAVAAQCGITKPLARQVVGVFVEQLWAATVLANRTEKKGKPARVEVPGFGTFRISTRKERRIPLPPGYGLELSPGAREAGMMVARSWQLAFRPAKLRKGVGNGPR